MLREPRPEEAHLFQEIYIDESSQNDHHFLVLGGIVIPRYLSAEFEADIIDARKPRLYSKTSAGDLREIAWSEVGKGDFERYRTVLDAYFSFGFRKMQNKRGLFRFYCSVVNLRVPGRNYSKGTKGQIGFNREIYFHCTRIASRERGSYLFQVYPDHRTTSQSVDKMAFMLSRGMAKKGDKRDFAFRRVKMRHSHEHQAIQISDILIGAIAYRLNRHYDLPNANKDKKLLCDYVLEKTGFKNFIGPTTFREKPFGTHLLLFRRHKT